MTDQQNPFGNMPEPPAAPDPAQAFDNAQCQGQAAQQPYGTGQGAYDPCQGQPQQPYQQPYQATYEQPQVSYQQVYAQPVAAAAPAQLYPMTDTDRNLRLVAFIFCILSLVGSCWLIIPLAWMIPMSVISWGIYKGTKANTVAFGVCTLIFCSLVAGILLLCSNKDR
ncbi:hypothetical protein [Adlercreutzia shanghongiae]|uniref:DUF4190 domain-containing protein n=1 Tax=Adlercreutzia shanghongiae TaxID=3111773 RepID=A0ABU6IVR9_9ACTN|nr:hypothetical protein [Adlercreutzia sp. R22]MEC4293924.1 hypothetical protein [Adlercreutzia sp. R22]